MKILATLGDSWTAGAELENREKDRYSTLLFNKLRYSHLYNLGIPGSSLEHLILQLQDLHSKVNADDDVTVVFWLTNPARSIYWPSAMSWSWTSEERSHWPTDAKETIKELFLYFHDRDSMRASMTITTLQQMCKAFGYRDFYLPGWVRYNNLLPSVDTEKIWKRGTETAADWFGASDHCGEHLINVKTNPYIKPNFSHANELGHKLIADKLAQWILSL